MRRFAPALLLLPVLALSACGPSTPPPPPAKLDPALLADLPAPYNTADLENGKQQFAVCKTCHTITADERNLTGPHLHGVFGRKAGGVADYPYSDVMKKAGFVWDAPHLDTWLKSPRDDLPGTKMTYPGMPDDKNRTDLIAYLKVAGSTPAQP